MEVFVNRARRAYLKKRAIREMALATFCFAAFVLLLGLAGRDQMREEQALEELYSRTRSICVVEWADSVPVYELGK